MRNLFCFVLLFSLWACVEPSAEEKPSVKTIDPWSYRLGGIGSFSEVVAVGIKKLALSSPMTPDEMDASMEEAERIAQENGVKIHRETDFLVTDLFPEEVTTGKHVLLIYLDPVKDEYMALKAEKEALITDGKYEGEARAEIARKLGRLLSYPEEHIERLLTR
jgi:hypothetical protein